MRWQVALVGGVALGASGCVVAKEGTWTFDGDIRRVVVELGNGDAEIVPSGTSKTHVELDFGGVSLSPVGPYRSGNAVYVNLLCDGVCGGDVFVEVPDDVWVEAHVHRGDLDIDGLYGGELDAIVGAGDLTITDTSVPRVGTSVGAGDGSIELDEVGCVSVQVGAGDASLDVPAGAYKLGVSVDAGHLEVDGGIVQDDQAERCIRGHVQAGHLDISSY